MVLLGGILPILSRQRFLFLLLFLPSVLGGILNTHFKPCCLFSSAIYDSPVRCLSDIPPGFYLDDCSIKAYWIWLSSDKDFMNKLLLGLMVFVFVDFQVLILINVFKDPWFYCVTGCYICCGFVVGWYLPWNDLQHNLEMLKHNNKMAFLLQCFSKFCFWDLCSENLFLGECLFQRLGELSFFLCIYTYLFILLCHMVAWAWILISLWESDHRFDKLSFEWPQVNCIIQYGF